MPVCMVNQNVMRAHDPSNERDMTGAHVPSPLEDEDPAHRRQVSPPVPPFGLVPPSGGCAIKRDAGFGAYVKRAIGGGRWVDRCSETSHEKNAPNEARDPPRSHATFPR